jgi:DNA-binding transcriptional ArsR family regulator
LISYRFGPEDLGRVRFAVSPVFELAASFDVLRDPARHAAHAPWARHAQRAVRGLDLTLLEAIHPLGRPYRPDFAVPPPEAPRARLDAELERVRATPPDQVARELGWTYEGTRLPLAVRAFLARPREGLARLTEVMAVYWERALEPWWPDLLAVLEADVAHRARRLAEAGPLGAFADLHPDVRWRDGALEVTRAYNAEVELEGRGIVLLPAVFVADVWALFDPPWQPTVVYAPRGVAELWAPERAAPGALAALVGGRRAAILATLARPADTQELARRLAASPAGVSEHLGVLRRAGLIAGSREGRRVRYTRTRAGEALVRAAGE